ncbi:hypothetical protein GCM10011581_29090 [Saccharopolyspora subtropica]|uniref:Uncharacterized protein n=1 Tax=Saccharopolyspora thermophila TaxID=89367 RepID=A0A917JY83_9PSEU|nr:hypothetical protein [Saccharopolyspora subtropica]GGI90218.1 hypothetical protein GCM10011581_29090 [Saccharopolyspora subtropica]
MATSTSARQHPAQRTRHGGRTTSAANPKRVQHGASIPVPYLTPQLHTYQIPLPRGEDVTHATQAMRGWMPSGGQALFYGGLAAAAVFSVIEWPVALAIGVGNALVQRSARRQGSAKPS